VKSGSILRNFFHCFLISAFALLLVPGCTVNKYLKENQYLLYKQTIKGNKKISKESFTPLFKQKPNRKVLGSLPYLYLYYVGASHLDTVKIQNKKRKIAEKYQHKIDKIDTSSTNKKKEKNQRKIDKLRSKRDKKLDKLNLKLKDGNWLMRVVGEPPSLYDTSSTNYNARQIKFYLNSKGYFLSSVKTSVDTAGKKVSETYTIEEKDPYTIKSIEYLIEDTVINGLIKINMKDALFTEGNIYDESKISAERDRINKLLKDNGYYDFNTQYIFIEIDSTLGQQQLAVRILVRNPVDQTIHPRYVINKVIFDADISSRQQKKDSVFFNGIYYIYDKDNFSKKILNKKIRLHTGEYYSQSKIQLTQRQLAALDMYKFININFEKNQTDTLKNGLIANIRTSPQKKFQITEEAGLNISSAGGRPGPFGSFSIKSRNTFRGFEIFETNLRASILAQAAVLKPENTYLSEEYSADLSLAFPQFFFPTSLRFKMEDYTPRTKFIGGYTLIRRPEYQRGNLRTSMNYILNKGQSSQYNISIVDLNFISTPEAKVSQEFKNYLDSLARRGNNLKYSFTNSIVSDINASYTFNNNQVGTNKRSRYVKIYGESGGTFLNVYNSLGLAENEKFFGKYQTFKYYKINTDFRYYYPIKKNTFVMRYNFGILHDYAHSDQLLPYEKYFFMGGSNSMRAWQPRRLGPGSYIATDPVTGEKTYTFEQPGQIMFETNFEYRFKIIGFFEGAAFIDAGNIWMIRDKAKPGAEFRFNRFFSQIAVGTGLGVRLNFSFLILRLDFGVKAIDPADGSRFVLFTKTGYKDPRLNIGIGYPF
jgi:outer membrane protein insertion porin family